MNFTTGVLILGLGIFACSCSLILLIVSRKKFRRQEQHVLKCIEEE